MAAFSTCLTNNKSIIFNAESESKESKHGQATVVLLATFP